MLIKQDSLSALKRCIQVDKTKQFYEDRLNELIEYSGISSAELEILNTKFPFSSDEYKKECLHKEFPNESTSNDEDLFNCYRRAAKKYIIRHLLGKTDKIDRMWPILKKIAELLKIQNSIKLKSYDYGCGIGDISLALYYMGFEVFGCDLDTDLLHFTKWRFNKRNINFQIDFITYPDLYPELIEGEYDIVICREVLEHIRNPLKVIMNIYNGLKSNGLFYTSSMYPNNYREIGGTHLKDSIQTAKSEAYINTFNSLYNSIDGVHGLYRKK